LTTELEPLQDGGKLQNREGTGLTHYV